MATEYSFKNPEMIIAGSALIVSLITAFACRAGQGRRASAEAVSSALSALKNLLDEMQLSKFFIPQQL